MTPSCFHMSNFEALFFRFHFPTLPLDFITSYVLLFSFFSCLLKCNYYRQFFHRRTKIYIHIYIFFKDVLQSLILTTSPLPLPSLRQLVPFRLMKPTTLNEGNQSARLNTGSLFRLSLQNCDNLWMGKRML